MPDSDCYFFIDESLPADEQVISPMCLPCYEQTRTDGAWFYRGSAEGYGPYDYRCAMCKEYIHRHGKTESIQPNSGEHVE